MKIKYPLGLDDSEKLVYAYRLNEQLRLLHNENGQKLRKGHMTPSQWNDFLTKVFMIRSELIMDEIRRITDSMSSNKNIVVDVINDFEG